MQSFLIGQHFLAVLMIVGAPLLASAVLLARRFLKPGFGHDQLIKLLFDLVTFIPVGVMLWNILIYNASYTFIADWFNGPPPAGAVPSKIGFVDAIAGTGEATIVLAVIIVFVRVAWDIGKDIVD
jgi:hypothetical protein